jgi:DNA-binding PadR family transcriptional regulator
MVDIYTICMNKPASVLHSVPRPAPDLTDRGYWVGTIKMSLSKFFVLRVLHDGPSHGYDIARAVERVTAGCCSPTAGGLYPVLKELEAGSYVTGATETVSGRERRVYTLTDRGRQAFRVGAEAWADVTSALLETHELACCAPRAGCR